MGGRKEGREGGMKGGWGTMFDYKCMFERGRKETGRERMRVCTHKIKILLRKVVQVAGGINRGRQVHKETLYLHPPVSCDRQATGKNWSCVNVDIVDCIL